MGVGVGVSAGVARVSSPLRYGAGFVGTPGVPCAGMPWVVPGAGVPCTGMLCVWAVEMSQARPDGRFAAAHPSNRSLMGAVCPPAGGARRRFIEL
ncbi:hypothetical protein ADL28_06740 [Streptomyces violaceusniger]|uniref:Uncharacterized protein n=1 Tax=Streptomyces violaceusniger TaxID=68280 RepID=A0A0X3X8I4_STRVO|nr:hypothetical protein ADL28_06740 [Streptomyces violaceusniger]